MAHTRAVKYVSPYINRFLQPDSIIPNPVNPQAFNRFSYVYNNPINLIDPSGHCGTRRGMGSCPQPGDSNGNSGNDLPRLRSCAGGCRLTGLNRNLIEVGSSGGCAEDDDACWMGQNRNGQAVTNGTTTGLDFSGYEDWEKHALLFLYNNGGQDAQHGVEYMLANGIHIEIGSRWDPRGGFGTRGAWFDDDSVFLPWSTNINALTQNRWALQNIIHEAVHIEQGYELSHSIEGERLAWQAGLRVFKELGGVFGTRELNVMSANNPVTFAQNLLTDDPGYAIPLIIWYPFYPPSYSIQR